MTLSPRALAASLLIASSLLASGPAAMALADPARPAAAAPAPRLASVDNFRDLAGTAGYRIADGKRVRAGVVYRANALTPNAGDGATLDGLGISAVYDLRTTPEVTAKPDRVPAGARYQRINIMGDGSSVASVNIAALTETTGRALLEDANVAFVRDAAQRARFAELLREIATAKGPVIVHCTAGKDRTGWAAALLLTIAGVSSSDIMADYLLTNEYSARSIDAAGRATQAKGGDAAAMRALMGVHREALQAGLDEAAKRYGSVDGYIRSGLGLDERTIGTVKSRLTA